MKKLMSLLLVLTMIFALAACSDNQTSSPDTSSSIPNLTVTDGSTLVVYFSMPETTDPNNMTTEEDNSVVVINGEVLGNTQYMAYVIQENTGANIFRIEPETPYPTDHDTLVDLAADEQEKNARPAIKDKIENFDQYDTIFVGYPNWWGDMPMILYSFFDEYDFSGKTIIPFNTHGGSGFSGTINSIKELEPKAQVQDGLSISRNSIQDAEQEIIDWVLSLGFTKTTDKDASQSETASISNSSQTSIQKAESSLTASDDSKQNNETVVSKQENPVSSKTDNPSQSSNSSSSKPNVSSTQPTKNSKSLVVYFSMPETTDPNNMTQEEANSTVVINGEVLGNTQYVAYVIQEQTGADIFRIEPETPYPTDHDTLVDLAADEQDENARPAIKDAIKNLNQYDTIFVGYPNWWGDMPMILYTFFDTYDFSGKTIIPFNTHGGSGFSGTIGTIADLEPNATVDRNGFTVSRNNVQDAEPDIISWLDELGY